MLAGEDTKKMMNSGENANNISESSKETAQHLQKKCQKIQKSHQKWQKITISGTPYSTVSVQFQYNCTETVLW